MKSNTSLKGDLIFIFIVTVLTIPCIMLIKLNDVIDINKLSTMKYAVNINILWFAMTLFIIFIAYLEAKHDDEYITGKTQRLGVINSFTSFPVLFIIYSIQSDKWLLEYIILIIIFICARILGRKSRKKLLCMIGKRGVMKTNLHNSGIASIEGKDVRVYSKKDIFYGANVEIVDLKAKYLYVDEI